MTSDLIRAVIDEKAKEEWKIEAYQRCWRCEKSLRINEKERKENEIEICDMLLNVNYITRIHIHRVIEKDEFFSRIDVDHDDAQNETCDRCQWFKIIQKNRRFQFTRCYTLISRRRVEFDKHFEFECRVRFFFHDLFSRIVNIEQIWIFNQERKQRERWKIKDFEK